MGGGLVTPRIDGRLIDSRATWTPRSSAPTQMSRTSSGFSFVASAAGVPGDAEEPLRDEIRRHPGLARALSHYE